MKIRTSRALATTLAAALTAGGLTAVATAPAMAADDERDLTVMTYNINHGVGLDGALDLGRIAADIRDAGAEVVASRRSTTTGASGRTSSTRPSAWASCWA